MDRKFWIAFKVNVIHDFTTASSSLDTAFQDMTTELEYNGVHLASLGANMRNVKSIGSCRNNLQTFSSTYADRKMTQLIETL